MITFSFPYQVICLVTEYRMISPDIFCLNYLVFDVQVQFLDCTIQEVSLF